LQQCPATEAPFRTHREFRDMDVSDLLRVATARTCGLFECRPGKACGVGNCEGPKRRLVACQWLRRYFPIEAKAFATARGLPDAQPQDGLLQDEGAHTDGVKLGWRDFWKQLEQDAQVEGELLLRRVCCRDVQVGVHLRPDGRPQPFHPVMLPVFTAQGELECLSEDVRRRRHATSAGLLVHGSDIVALPSDFLCQDCVSEFRRISEAQLASDAVLWRKKLHMHSKVEPGDVLREREALKIRDDLVKYARDDDAGGLSREIFWQDLVRHREQLGYKRCESVLEPLAKESLDPVQYWEEPLPEYCTTTRSVFGLLFRNDKLHCRALPRESAGAARWSDYTGLPGLVEEKVWQWRLWAFARGGFEALRFSEQSHLESAEGRGNPDFLRVQRPHGVFGYGLDLKPAGVVPSV
jgi:hypothetical protein